MRVVGVGLVWCCDNLCGVTEGTLLADAGRREEIAHQDSRGLGYFQRDVRSDQQLLSLGRRLELRLKLSPKVDPDR